MCPPRLAPLPAELPSARRPPSRGLASRRPAATTHPRHRHRNCLCSRLEGSPGVATPTALWRPPHAARKWVPVARANHTGGSSAHPARAPAPAGPSNIQADPWAGELSTKAPQATAQGHQEGTGGWKGQLGAYVGSGPSLKPSQLDFLHAHTPAEALGTAGGGRWASHWCRTVLSSSSQHWPA